MTTSERILEVMDCLDVTPYVLEKECGIKNAQAKISHYKKGITKAISFDVLAPFCEAYPQVNANYILSGKGDMFIDYKNEQQQKGSYRKGVVLPKSIVDSIAASAVGKKVKEINPAFPEISSSFLKLLSQYDEALSAERNMREKGEIENIRIKNENEQLRLEISELKSKSQ